MTRKESKPKSGASKRAKHTPGRWLIAELKFASHRQVDQIIRNEETRIVAKVPKFHGDPNAPPEAEGHANARLICAAPDLLATAKKVSAIIAEWAETCGDELGWAKGDEKDQAINAFVAAISKAEGRK